MVKYKLKIVLPATIHSSAQHFARRGDDVSKTTATSTVRVFG